MTSCVLGNLRFDRRPNLGRGPEEAICRYETPQALVWPLEVIGLDE